MIKVLKYFLVLIIGFGVFLPSFAYAELQILPTRSKLDDRNRSVDVIVRNTSNTTNTYLLRWNDHKISETGGLKALGVDATSALDNPYAMSKLVRVAPRQVIIPPGESQLIRLSLRRPKGLPEGEYYSHLAFVSKKDKLNQDEILRRQSTRRQGIGVEIIPTLSFNVPIFARHGEGVVEPKIQNIRFAEPTKNAKNLVLLIEVGLSEDSNNSPYGGIDVIWEYEGEEKNIGFIRNVYTYPKSAPRKYNLPLSEAFLPGGTLKITYFGKDEYSGQIFDEKIIQLAQ